MKKSVIKPEWITEVKVHCACPCCQQGITVIVEPKKLAEDDDIGVNVIATGAGLPGTVAGDSGAGLMSRS